MDRFDEAYATVADYFGSDPENILMVHETEIPRELPILDLGCGQGRNTLPLARRGFTLDALDPSHTAIEHVAEIAAREDLAVRTLLSTFQNFDPGERLYGAILVFGLIQEIGRREITLLTRMLPSILAPSGLVFITAFGTWDPAYTRHAATWATLGDHSFRSPDGITRSYLEPGEIIRFFPGFEALHTWEGMGPEHRHGDGPIERHGRIEAVLRRKSDLRVKLRGDSSREGV